MFISGVLSPLLGIDLSPPPLAIGFPTFNMGLPPLDLYLPPPPPKQARRLPPLEQNQH